MRTAACAGGLYSLAVALLTLSVFELASQKKKGIGARDSKSRSNLER